MRYTEDECASRLIAPDHADQVISVIGLEQARKCTCLPGYKERFQILSVQ